MAKSPFTKVQTKMLEVLSDGERHTREDLHACLWDENGRLSNIRPHIGALRKMLAPLGQTIVCELYFGLIYYRQVVLLSACRCSKKALKRSGRTYHSNGKPGHIPQANSLLE